MFSSKQGITAAHITKSCWRCVDSGFA